MAVIWLDLFEHDVEHVLQQITLTSPGLVPGPRLDTLRGLSTPCCAPVQHSTNSRVDNSILLSLLMTEAAYSVQEAENSNNSKLKSRRELREPQVFCGCGKPTVEHRAYEGCLIS